ncbi:MAG: hypothetical protein QOC87_1420 [Actinomycetota bacterium]|jgi:nucleoside-diphosphate-sugar epimerase|nr:hypothetical protein [Actinomycetota bacterium]
MRIFLAGGSGAVGRPLLSALIELGHQVTVLTRSDATAGRLERAGARAVVGDAFDRDAMIAAVEGSAPEVLIHQLTAIPAAIPPKKIALALEPTNRLRTQGTANLIAGALRAGTRRIIAQSIAFAYAPGGEPIKGEDAPLYLDAPKEWVSVNLAIHAHEQQIVTADMEGVVLRYGFFYGPGTQYAHDGFLAAEARKRRLPIVGTGTGVTSFIHVEDAAKAAVAMLGDAPPGTYNVVDDAPATAREWIPVFCRAVGAPKPMRIPAVVARPIAGRYGVYVMTELPGASNAKIKSETSWTPAYPTWRAALGTSDG